MISENASTFLPLSFGSLPKVLGAAIEQANLITPTSRSDLAFHHLKLIIAPNAFIKR